MKSRYIGLLFAIALLVPFIFRAVPTQAASTGLRVGIYSGTGAESDKILALFRAVAANGHSPLAITRSDILQGRLTRANFDVFILPAGEDGKRCCAGHYSDDGDSLGGIPAQDAIRAYLNSGGGMVGIEAGANFGSINGGTLDVYKANYNTITTAIGKQTMTIVDATFGSGAQEAWQSYGGGYFSTVAGATVVAKDSANRPVIVRAPYNAGRVIMSAWDLELRGDSELDWTIWDNWAMGGAHANSAGAWSMLGRMIGWAYNGDSSAPTLSVTPNPSGARVAVLASHNTDGGAWPGLLPAVARSIEYSGHVPLAIRFQEIKDNRLTAANFKVLTVPGGYAYGYKTGLAGHEQKIRDFLTLGGGYYGICAGAFYAPDTIVWEGKTYAYPLQIYKGISTGPVADLAPWPQYVLTPMNVSGDAVIGNLGTIQQMYYGGGSFSIPTVAQQGTTVYTASTFAYSGTDGGKPGMVRYTYGAGHVVLITTHPEARAGSNLDWMYWDNFAVNSNTPVSNPDNPWTVVNSALDNWLTLP
jgi:glutamine amidotransferase-like uncharacterized protein